MTRSWGILCAILLIFGFLEPANSAIIGLNDITKNLVSENPKFNNVIPSAAANVITNGDFANGLSAWAIINPDKHPSGITAVDIDGPGPLKSSDAFFVQTGGGYDTKPASIIQSIKLVTGGAYTLFANIAASYFPAKDFISNRSGGVITVTLDGKTIDTYDFGEISRNTLEYATLSASFVAVASGILDINFFRPFGVDNSPTNYLDNISLALNNSAGAPVPEPATMLLLGTGLVGLAGYSKKKLKKN